MIARTATDRRYSHVLMLPHADLLAASLGSIRAIVDVGGHVGIADVDQRGRAQRVADPRSHDQQRGSAAPANVNVEPPCRPAIRAGTPLREQRGPHLGFGERRRR